MISNRQRGLGVLIRASLIFTSGANLVATISTIMDFRPDVESVESNPAILVRVIRPSSTASRNKIGETRREMSDQIVAVSHSEGIGDVGNNSRGKVIVTNSGRTESVELHIALGDKTAQSNIQSSVSSKSTTQTVTSKVDMEALVLVQEGFELAEEVGSEEISVLNIEIIGGNGIFDGVETVSDGTRLEDFFG